LRLAQGERRQLLRSLRSASLLWRGSRGGAAGLRLHAGRRQLAHVLATSRAKVVTLVERVLLPRQQLSPHAWLAGGFGEAGRKDCRSYLTYLLKKEEEELFFFTYLLAWT